jgi:hypothetical protein
MVSSEKKKNKWKAAGSPLPFLSSGTRKAR